jgi:ubiquinone/menaquinone biosynthesis C-methylase UbiE
MKVCTQCYEKFANSSWICPACNFEPTIIDDHLSFAPHLTEENEGFEASYFFELATLEAKNFWFRSRNQLILWALLKYFPSAKNLLEIGCGTGFVLSGIEQSYPELALHGSEIFTKGLNLAADRLSKQVALYQMDARRIPFEDEFDIIGAFDVLEHIPEDQSVLDEMYRATSHNGGIMLTVPQHLWLWSRSDDYARHVRRYCVDELGSKVEQAGFEVVRITSFVSFLLPLMFLSRLQQRKSHSKYDIFSELKIGGCRNQLLEYVMTWERRCIQTGISFPFGGSLLLLAKKQIHH